MRRLIMGLLVGCLAAGPLVSHAAGPATKPTASSIKHDAPDEPSVEVRKIDDTKVAGQLHGVEAERLVLVTLGPNKIVNQTFIPLDEIAEVTSVQTSGKAPTKSPEKVRPAKKSDNPVPPANFGKLGTTQPSATQPAVSTAWTISLNNGDTLRGTEAAWGDKSLSVQSDLAEGTLVQIPIDQIKAAWLGSTDQVKQAKAIKLDVGPEDAAFVVKEGQVVVVRGVVLGIDGASLRFKFNDQERKIGLAKLVGVVLGAQETKRDDRFRFAFELQNGDTLSGNWKSFQYGSAVIETNFGATFNLPWAMVNHVRGINGQLVYVSDLKPAHVEETPFFDRTMPWKADHSLTGGPIKLVDGEYKKGIAVHSRCVLEYDIAGEYVGFASKVGFSQPDGRLGQAVVRVLGDGRVLYEDLDARGDAMKPAEVSVDVTGVKRLTLEVDFGKNEDTGDRVVWANARLRRAARK